MALKGPGKTLKNSPYGKLPPKTTKKPKKNTSGSKELGTSSNTTAGEGVPLKEIFGALADENGRITSSKLRTYVKELDLDFTEEEIKDMMQVVDPAGKGEISYNNLLGIVRDFSHEFPTVQLTADELNRELTADSIVTIESAPGSSKGDEFEQPSAIAQEQPSTSTQDILDSSETIEKNETESENSQVSRPYSSRIRIAALAKKAIEDLDDKMSVIKEDDELEDGEKQVENNGLENDKETDGEEYEEENDEIVDDNKENETATVGNKKSVASDEDVTKLSKENTNIYDEDITIPKNDETSETESDINGTENVPSRASIVKEHRLDSGVSTAIGRMDKSLREEKNITENGRRSRKGSTSESRSRSRRDSVKSDTSRKLKNTSTSKISRESSRTKQSERRKSVARKKFQGVNDPEFYSTMGCSLKLSQIRTRQRLLYVMWRAVYDQAVTKMEQEKAKLKAQKKKNVKNVKANAV